MPPDLQPLYPALRLVTAQVVSLTELHSMSLDDVNDLNDVIAAEAAAQARWRKEHAK